MKNFWQRLSLAIKPIFGQVTVVICALLLVGTVVFADKTGQQPLVTNTIRTTKAAVKTTPPPTPTPTVTSAPAPTAPVAHKSVTTSTQPAAVVTPSPSSNVTGLSPTDTGSSTASSSSGGSSAGSQQTNGYTSLNWAGYLAANQTFTTVSGSWSVPAASGNGTTATADATWIGIGGVTSNDLIQVGTENTVTRSGILTSSAFYELLPGNAIIITTLPVSAGDGISAVITETGASQWTITITDTTTGLNYTTSVTYSSSNSTAEWIEEDPSYARGNLVPFDNFGSVHFSGATTTANGSNQGISAVNAQPITLVSRGGTPIATPSAISGNGFSVTHD